MTESIETTTYEVVTSKGKFRMDLPSTYKVTYGPVAIGGGAKDSRYGQGTERGSMCLRVYDEGAGTKARQRAVIVGVRSFRDLSIPFLREAVRKVGTDTWFRVGSPDAPVWSQTTSVEYGWAPEEDIKGRPPEKKAVTEEDPF